LREKLATRLKLAYGVGQVAEGLKNGAFGTFLVFYYVQVLGLSGTLAGFAVGLAVVVDAFTDPLAGSVSDNWHSKRGRRHPFIFAAILPLAICFYLLFNPLVTGDTALFIWLLVFTNATRTAMSFYHVPHIALGAEMSEDYDERSNLVSFRLFFSYVGVLLAYGLGTWLFFRPSAEFQSGQLDATAYPPYALALALLMVISVFWSAWHTRVLIPNLPQAKPGASTKIVGVLLQVLVDLRDAMRSRSFRWLFLGVLIVFIMAGIDSGLNLFVFTYFWELPTGQLGLLLVMFPLGVMIGVFFSARLFRRFSKKTGLIFGALSWPFWQTLPVVLRLLGWFPENSDELLLPILMVMRFIQGVCTIQAHVAFSSMVADIIDEHELETGKRQEGIFFAAASFSSKATSGIGNIIAGFALDIIGWPRGPEVKTAADVAPETIVDLGLVYGPYFALFGFVSVWCYTHYNLTRERHEEILQALAIRRQER
jgi:GPH family glycoside/pentoside/hexuronide:cation symporter